MPPKRGTFGHGYARGTNRKTPPLPQLTNDQKYPVKIKQEKLHDLGHILSLDCSKGTFTIKKVLDILREQDDTKYEELELKQMLTIWRKYKGKRMSGSQYLRLRTCHQQ